MVKIVFRPGLAKLLISPREIQEFNDIDETSDYLEKEIIEGRWKQIPPIWLTPNFLLNGFFCGWRSFEWHPTYKPFIVYNGHHRLLKALEHNLPVSAYIRYTPGNLIMPGEERLQEDMPY